MKVVVFDIYLLKLPLKCPEGRGEIARSAEASATRLADSQVSVCRE
jgi:hypothetical protein